MRTIFKFILLITLLPSFANIVLAGNIQAISYGDVVTGTLTSESYEHLYSFKGQAGDVIIIKMESPMEDVRLDSFLVLRDPEGNDLLTDDDMGGNLNSFIGPVSLFESGTYTIVATRFGREEGTSTGDYSMTVDFANEQEIVLNTPYLATLEDVNTIDYMTFTADQEGLFRVDLRLLEGQSNLDLTILTTEGNHLTGIGVNQDDIDNFTVIRLDANESVTILIRNYGYYDNSGEQIEATATIEALIVLVEPTYLTVNIEQSATVEDVLEDTRSVDFYEFGAMVGQTLTIEGAVERGNFDIYLVSPSGVTTYYGTTFGGVSQGQNTVILSPQILTLSGEYTVVVHRTAPMEGYNITDSVEYSMTVLLSETPEILPDVPVSGTITHESMYEDNAYIYAGEAGETINIMFETVTANYGVTFSIEQFNPDAMGHHMAAFYMNFSASTAGRMTYDVTLPFDGSYIVRLYNGNYDPQVTSGEYRIVIDSDRS